MYFITYLAFKTVMEQKKDLKYRKLKRLEESHYCSLFSLIYNSEGEINSIPIVFLKA
jgi:hypothetical protein